MATARLEEIRRHRHEGKTNAMRSIQFFLVGILLMPTTFSCAASATTFGFDQDRPGSPPSGWTCGVTGRGGPIWSVRSDPSAPSKPNVLVQNGNGTFPWCIRPDVFLRDGFVEVKFKPEGGREDQAGGLLWRWQNADHYYVARANALENNVSLYYTDAGRRITLKYVDAPVPRAQWSILRVEFVGKRIRVFLNGKSCIDIDDTHIVDAGAVGVWTKADSVTAFDDFSFGDGRQAQ